MKNQVKYTLKEDEYIEYVSYLASRTATVKRSITLFALSLPVILACVLIMKKPSGWVWYVLCLLLAGAWIALASKTYPKMLANLVGAKLKSRPYTANEVSLKLDDDSFSTVSEGKRVVIDSVDGYTLLRKVIVASSGNYDIVVPLRVFDGDDERNDFLARIAEIEAKDVEKPAAIKDV